MKWNTALVISYGTPVAGREGKAMEVFADALTMFGKLAANGQCSEPELFHHLVGGGMMIVRTETFEMAHEILEMEDVATIIDTAVFTVNDFDVAYWVTGEKLMHNMSLYTAIGTELAYI